MGVGGGIRHDNVGLAGTQTKRQCAAHKSESREVAGSICACSILANWFSCVLK